MQARALAILGFILVLSGGGAPASAVPEGAGASRWLRSVDQAVERAAADGRYILVDLYAEWCGWCRMLEREVFADPEFVAYARDFVLLWVNVEDGGEGSELQARFGATSLPTTLILDPRRVKVGEVAGFHPTGRFIAALEAEIDAYRGLLDLFDKVVRSGDAELQQRLAEDFHQRGDGRRAAALYEQVLERLRGADAAWLHYRAADAYRLGGELGAAEPHLERSRALATELGDPPLLERLELLAFHIAQDRGDCAEAVATLERFLAEHPGSAHRGQARRMLQAIRKGEEMECT